MTTLVTSKRVIFLLGFLAAIVFVILGYELLSSKKASSNAIANLAACEKNVLNQASELSICETKMDGLFQLYGECTQDSCLFVNKTAVEGFFTFTADTVTEKKDFMGQEAECTYVVITDAPVTPSFLLEERFPESGRFALNGEVPENLKNRNGVVLTTTFPFAPDFGPLACDGPLVSIISK